MGSRACQIALIVVVARIAEIMSVRTTLVSVDGTSDPFLLHDFSFSNLNQKRK
jgi:hypothetical protein